MTHPTKLGTVQTIDMNTGEVVKTKKNAFMMLPPRDGVCAECAVDHARDAPHNKQSLFYQQWFHARHGRWPTWSDALRHCTPEVQACWKANLIQAHKDHGLPVPDDLLEGPAPGR